VIVFLRPCLVSQSPAGRSRILHPHPERKTLHTLLKSEVGPFPEPVVPSGIDLTVEDRKARRRLYPVTVAYTVLFLVVLALAVRAGQAPRALGFVALGAATWTLVEYLSHRYLFHVAFPRGKGPVRDLLHHVFDASHVDHHAHPWDGYHINGHLDTLFVAVVLVPLSLLGPSGSTEVAAATLFACYVAEEWAHHGMHFWSFRWRYFRYLRARHLYHHSRHGAGTAFGITSDFWDKVFGTRIPAPQRQRLLPRPAVPVARA
jgi:sterol desaturase/sphingolipid hydroxylase (fatty acid hydroxylase superfamily)